MLAFACGMRENVTMTEIQPMLTYTPEGMLEIKTDTFRMTDYHLQKAAVALGALSEYPGVAYDETPEPGSPLMLNVHVDIKRALGLRSGYGEYGDMSNLLAQLSVVMPSLFQDQTKDNVIVPRYLKDDGFWTRIHESFQRWLNTQARPSEEVAIEVLEAMAVPFGRGQEENVRKKLKIDKSIARAAGMSLAITSADFEVFAYSTIDDREAFEKEGRAHWNVAGLATVGGATYDVDKEAFERTDVSADMLPMLYEMGPVNVENAQQSLSLLLGIGALAYRASQYTGREDVLAGVNWQSL